MEVEEEKKKKHRKKRKERNPEQEMEVEKEKKKKKKEIVKEEIDVKMEIVPECSDKISPIVGYFPSGFDPQKATDQLDIKVYRYKETMQMKQTQRSNHRLQLVVSPRNSNIDFVGTSYTGEAAASQTCTYALGVLDKETRCLKIVPIACNKIFRLEPRVAGSESYEKALVKVKEEALTGADTTVSKVDYLTKRARKKLELYAESRLQALLRSSNWAWERQARICLRKANSNRESINYRLAPKVHYAPLQEMSVTRWNL